MRFFKNNNSIKLKKSDDSKYIENLLSLGYIEVDKKGVEIKTKNKKSNKK